MSRIPKRPTAVMFGYNGLEFFGSQYQGTNARSVENSLIEGLHKAGCISDQNVVSPQKFHFQRASRTDKGVHAKNTVIRLQCQWDDRNDEQIVNDINAQLDADIRVFALRRVTNGFNPRKLADYREYEYLFPVQYVFAEGVDEGKIARMNEIATQFVGTHRFHNYTKMLGVNAAQAKRYILAFEIAQNLQKIEATDYLRFVIRGQSFLYHQIRKMVGMVVAVTKEVLPIEQIQDSFGDCLMRVPMAPAQGLYLGSINYDTYNKRFPDKSVELELGEVQAMLDFYNEKILTSIQQAESQGVFAKWTEELINPPEREDS